MKLSQRLFRTSERQARLGRHEVAAWYWSQRSDVIASGNDPEYPALRNILERYRSKEPFVKLAPSPANNTRNEVHMPTDAQRTALAKLRDNGGEGVIDQHGKIVASGVRLLGLEPITWLRLITKGFVEVRGHLRIGITAKGEEALATAPGPKVNPHGIQGSRHQRPARLAGAE